jgi:hypothetical protein
MSPVFADTFYFVAFLNHRDAQHERVRRVSRELRRRVLTTSWVLTEVADALCDPPNRLLAGHLRRLVAASPFMRVIPANEELWRAGFDLFEARPDKEWSLTDCISFVVMEREQLTEALTGDHHFEQAGFTALLKE